MKAGAGRQHQARTGGDPVRQRRNSDGKALALHVDPPLRYALETGRLGLTPARRVVDSTAVQGPGPVSVDKREFIHASAFTTDVSIDEVSGSPVGGYRMDQNTGASKVFYMWQPPTGWNSKGRLRFTFYYTALGSESGKLVEFELEALAWRLSDTTAAVTTTAVNSGELDHPTSEGPVEFFTYDISQYAQSDMALLYLELKRTSSSQNPGVSNDPIIVAAHIDYQMYPANAGANSELEAVKAELAALKRTLRDGGYLEK